MTPHSTPTIVGSLPERLAAALKRRVGQGNAMTIKQLAYALRVSDETVWQWMSGSRNPRGDHLCALIQMFGPAFANEVIGSSNIYVINPQADRRAELLQRMAETQAELLSLEEVAAR